MPSRQVSGSTATDVLDTPTPSEPHRELPRALEPRYRIVRLLGAGAMGEVYLAEDARLRRNVAIKSIRSDRCSSQRIVERIKRECLLHAKIGAHPNIVTLFDIVETGSQIHLVMEHVEGTSLEEVVQTGHGRPGLALDASVDIAVQCLRGLAHTHRHGIVHRDIKPSNILLSKDESGKHLAKLMDFGIARMEEGDAEAATLTRPGEGSPGTPLYMSPEQIDSSKFGRVTTASDIYSMGALLYAMLAGRPPFLGTLTDVYNGHLNFVPKPILFERGGRVPPALMAIVLRAMKKMPADRFASAAAFEEALSNLVAQGVLVDTRATAVGSVMATALRPITTRLRSRRSGWAAAAVAVAVLAIGAALWPRTEAIPGGAERPEPMGVSTSQDTAPRPVVIPEQQGTSAEELPQVVAESVSEPAPAPDNVEPMPSANEPATDSLAQQTESPSQQDAEDGPITPEPVAATSPELQAEGNDPADPVAGTVETLPEPADIAQHQDDMPAPPMEDAQAEAATEIAETVEAPATAPAEPGTATPQGVAQEEAPRMHVVQAGESLSKIAAQHGIEPADLARWNLLRNPNAIFVGQELYLYERPDLPPIEVDWESGATSKSTPKATPSAEPEPDKREGGFFQRTKERLKKITGGNKQD